MQSRKTRTTMQMLLAAAMLSGIACQAPAPVAPATPDYEAQLSPALETFIEVWISKEYDKLDGVVAPDFRRVAPDQSADGLAALKDFMAQVHKAYPDFHIVLNETLYGDDLAFTYWTVTGTNTGEGSFPPTGKSVNIPGITMLRFADGMITDEIVQYDTATMMAQLGLAGVPHAE